VTHHRYIQVTLTLEVADPATPPAQTSDSDIKTDLVTEIDDFKPKIKGKNSDIKNVKAAP
jgi:hypothetical protein